jgi:hypothetical protein
MTKNKEQQGHPSQQKSKPQPKDNSQPHNLTGAKATTTESTEDAVLQSYARQANKETEAHKTTTNNSSFTQESCDIPPLSRGGQS